MNAARAYWIARRATRAARCYWCHQPRTPDQPTTRTGWGRPVHTHCLQPAEDHELEAAIW